MSTFECALLTAANAGGLVANNTTTPDVFEAFTTTAPPGIDRCQARDFTSQPTASALLDQPFGSLFPDEILGNVALEDEGLQACRQLLEDRGCTFN